MDQPGATVFPEPVDGHDIKSRNFFTAGGRDPNTDPITIGLGATKGKDGKPIRLASCTALIVMSEKAVWFGHSWESLSYGTNEIVQNEVLDSIVDGND